MNKAQWIVIGIGVFLVAGLFRFGRTSPKKSEIKNPVQSSVQNEITADSILVHAKEALKPEQAMWVNNLEQSVIRGDIKSQQLDVYHQLAHFWKDSIRIFEPYAWYEAESARLENSEKSLTFAAHLILENLRNEQSDRLKRWKALQAKDLFERSLKINDKNDSSLVGLGACYLFGNISENPMQGVSVVRQVIERDSTNIFAHMVLGQGAILSEQYSTAINRFEKVLAIEPKNLEATMRLAEIFERKGDTVMAVKWYNNALPLSSNSYLKMAVEERIKQLSEKK